MKIIVVPVGPPIPTHHFDFCAYIDGREEDPQQYGYGATKEEALEALGLIIVDRVQDHLFDIDKEHLISPAVYEMCLQSFYELANLPH